MLDAAHGDTVRASEPPKRAHAFRPEVERAGVEIAGRKRRRKPPMPAGTDSIQDSRLTGAVARSRRSKAVARMNAAEGAEQWFLLRLPVRRSALRAVRAAALAGEGLQTSGCRRACPAGCAPNIKPFVILNEVKNLFPCEPKAADGLCRARKRKTNAVPSRIYDKR